MVNAPMKMFVVVEDSNGGEGVRKACLGLARRWEGA